ncbi:MAG TPA: prephenate dehydrogenase/arogenate dehydrogenase family protein [Gemmatimonadaceae bacterium]|nr:prephenate dehydrogenase/arogenate dehydrogenase family protein [Gemmatimonadaceae bacterium]
MTEPAQSRLAQLRAELAALDESLLRIVAQRQALAGEIGRIKSKMGRSTRDFAQEKEVIGRVRGAAKALDLDPNLAEQISLMLIRASLTVQEQDRVHASAGGEGKRVLIIGGAGKMGRWFARFLNSQGFSVEIADPAGSVGDFPHLENWRESSLDHDIIVVAAPLRQSAAILEELATRSPEGIVFDVGSLKTPLRRGLRKLVDAGVRATSMHPMFGPDTELLSGRHVIFVDVGVPEATQVARDLFASTMVVQVEMDLDSHDRTVAYILGLSHAVNIAFLAALAESGEHAERLKRLSSTTFDAQLDVARRVAGENPHLYFEIQSLNEYGESALAGLRSAVERLSSAVASGNEAEFTSLMGRGAEYVREAGGGKRVPPSTRKSLGDSN